MEKDTMNIKAVTDHTIKANHFIEKTTTIEKITKSDSDYISKGIDCISSCAWPITIFFVILILKKNITELLEVISKKISNSKSITISKEGIFMVSDVTIPLDKNTNDTSQKEIFPEFPLTDNQSKKILYTLWTQQNKHDKDYNKRWTFTLGPNNPDYSSFTISAQRLQWLGLITYEPSKEQFFLTDYGIRYCKQNEKSIGDLSFF